MISGLEIKDCGKRQPRTRKSPTFHRLWTLKRQVDNDLLMKVHLLMKVYTWGTVKQHSPGLSYSTTYIDIVPDRGGTASRFTSGRHAGRRLLHVLAVNTTHRLVVLLPRLLERLLLLLLLHLLLLGGGHAILHDGVGSRLQRPRQLVQSCVFTAIRFVTPLLFTCWMVWVCAHEIAFICLLGLDHNHYTHRSHNHLTHSRTHTHTHTHTTHKHTSSSKLNLKGHPGLVCSLHVLVSDEFAFEIPMTPQDISSFKFWIRSVGPSSDNITMQTETFQRQLNMSLCMFWIRFVGPSSNDITIQIETLQRHLNMFRIIKTISGEKTNK